MDVILLIGRLSVERVKGSCVVHMSLLLYFGLVRVSVY